MIRTVPESRVSILGYALMGMMHKHPVSGYDLRKLFTSTPLAYFSDSPGAIYPALHRLEAQGLIRGSIEGSRLKRRKVFRLTTAGNIELKRWLRLPVRRQDVVSRMSELTLRFSLMDGVVPEIVVLRFLTALVAELESYVSELHSFLQFPQTGMPLSGRLALESGVRGYVAQLQWAKDALATYKKREGRKVKQ